MTTMRLMMRMMTLMALMTLTACDYLAKDDLKNERESAAYRSAMADSQAGRLEAALAGFRKVIAQDPAHANARFQLANLLQESGRDWVEAYCNYREYLRQHPESEKARLAQSRLMTCEREVARVLAGKYDMKAESVKMGAELADLRKQLAESRARADALEKELSDLRVKHTALSDDKARLVRLVKDDAEPIVPPPTAEYKNVKSLLEDDESTENSSVNPVDVAQLRQEEKEELAPSSTLLPAQAADAKQKRDAAAAAAEEARRRAAMPTHPETYVVQEGDTLYRIAVKFYGHISAWRKIRDANKTRVSVDGRVKAGDRLVLPK